jgi:hypothetical protein
VGAIRFFLGFNFSGLAVVCGGCSLDLFSPI